MYKYMATLFLDMRRFPALKARLMHESRADSMVKHRRKYRILNSPNLLCSLDGQSLVRVKPLSDMNLFSGEMPTGL